MDTLEGGGGEELSIVGFRQGGYHSKRTVKFGIQFMCPNHC